MTDSNITDLLSLIEKNRTSPAADHLHRPKEIPVTTSHTPPAPAGGQPPDDAPVENYSPLLFDAAQMWADRAAETERNVERDLRLMRGRAAFYLELANKQRALEEQEEKARGTAPGDKDLRLLQATAAATGIPAPPANGHGHITDQAPASARPAEVHGPGWASTGT